MVAGFQGVSFEKEITTLGRGGSDTTAIALAAALEADRCDLIKEVPGIFTGDPAVVPGAIPIPEMDFAAARGLSLGGARILKDDCIELAERYNIEIRVGSPEQFTVIQSTVPDKPFFSITLKEGLRLYDNFEITDTFSLLDDMEAISIDDKTVLVCENPLSEMQITPKFSDVVTGISKLTAVGDGLEALLPLFKSDKEVSRIYCFTLNRRECKILFVAEEPEEVLRRVHEKLAKKIPGVTNL